MLSWVELSTYIIYCLKCRFIEIWTEFSEFFPSRNLRTLPALIPLELRHAFHHKYLKYNRFQFQFSIHWIRVPKMVKNFIFMGVRVDIKEERRSFCILLWHTNQINRKMNWISGRHQATDFIWQCVLIIHSFSPLSIATAMYWLIKPIVYTYWSHYLDHNGSHNFWGTQLLDIANFCSDLNLFSQRSIESKLLVMNWVLFIWVFIPNRLSLL